LHRFLPTLNENDDFLLDSQFNSPGDKLKHLENREPTQISFSEWNITHLSPQTMLSAQNSRADVARQLIDLLKERFASLNEHIFTLMDGCNPELWSDEKEFGIEEIQEFAEHFKTPLNFSGFDKAKVLKVVHQEKI